MPYPHELPTNRRKTNPNTVATEVVLVTLAIKRQHLQVALTASEVHMDKTLRFVKSDDTEESLGILRAHASNAQKIAFIMSISEQKSKAIAKRGRDALVAALKEGRL
jgi:2-oxo-4-hydroxy-4-carboxy--5-ureidoimidazoline (OHCU) decarboxylase